MNLNALIEDLERLRLELGTGNIKVAIRHAEFGCANEVRQVFTADSNFKTYKGHYGRDEEGLGDHFVELDT